MKRKINLILLILTISLMFPFYAYADIGPKPSIKLIVLNPPEEEYYLDLLIDYEIKNPCINISEDEKDELNIEMLTILEEYNEDGFRPALVTGTKMPLFGHLTGQREGNTMVHEFSYRGVPDRFKVIVVEKSGNVTVSENIIERKAFESTVYYDYAENNLWETSTTFAYIKQFLRTFTITLIVEGIILLLFRFSLKKNWKIFTIVNFITQILLTIIVFSVMYFYGSMAAFLIYIPFEIVILIIEAKLYKKYLEGHSVRRRVLYAIVANLVSFSIGIWEVLGMW